MPDSYTTLWTNDLRDRLANGGWAGRRFRVLFGCRHKSLPTLSRVRPDDRIYPLYVRKRKVHVLAEVTLDKVVPYGDVDTLLEPDEAAAVREWEEWQRNCLLNVAVARASTPVDFDAFMPPNVLEELRYVSRKGEERGLRRAVDGELMNIAGVQGLFRLSPPPPRRSRGW